MLEIYNRLMDGNNANLVVTDPPYNVDYSGGAGKIKNDNMKDEEFYNFLFAAFVNMKASMEQDASSYVFHADTEGLNFRKEFQAAGFYLSGTCIWKKQSLMLGRSPYQWQHEPVLFGWKKGGKHNLNLRISRELIERLRMQYPDGTRVELVSMDDPYTKLKLGDKGTVKWVDDTGTIHISWDRGSSLGVVYGVDSCKIIEE